MLPKTARRSSFTAQLPARSCLRRPATSRQAREAGGTRNAAKQISKRRLVNALHKVSCLPVDYGVSNRLFGTP